MAERKRKLETVVAKLVRKAVGGLAEEVGIGTAVAITVPKTDLGRAAAAYIEADLENADLNVTRVERGEEGELLVVTE